MSPETKNFENYEKQSDTPKNTNTSAENFTTFVNTKKEIQSLEQNDPSNIPTDEDFEKAFDSVVPAGKKLGTENKNVQPKVTFSEKKYYNGGNNVNIGNNINFGNINQNNPNSSINIGIKK